MCDDAKDIASLPESKQCPLAPLEREALRFARNWYRHPAILAAFSSDGVNLAEMLEYDAYLLVHQVLKEHLGDSSP